jgi:hypothetical protein
MKFLIVTEPAVSGAPLPIIAMGKNCAAVYSFEVTKEWKDLHEVVVFKYGCFPLCGPAP